LDHMDQEAEELMEEAIRFADDSPMPELSELYEDVYVDYPLDMMRRGVNMAE
jgi:TPP-dependent pyruvate/acetoin dehydrogenase alpha subunit